MARSRFVVRRLSDRRFAECSPQHADLAGMKHVVRRTHQERTQLVGIDHVGQGDWFEQYFRRVSGNQLQDLGMDVGEDLPNFRDRGLTFTRFRGGGSLFEVFEEVTRDKLLVLALFPSNAEDGQSILSHRNVPHLPGDVAGTSWDGLRPEFVFNIIEQSERVFAGGLDLLPSEFGHHESRIRHGNFLQSIFQAYSGT